MMLDKLEKIVNTVKTAVLYILAPILAILYLLPLVKRKPGVTNKGEQEVSQDDCKGAVDKNEAILAVDSYRKLRDEYLKQQGVVPTPHKEGKL